MDIQNNVYNIPIVSVGTVTSGTKTEIGTKADFDKLVSMIEKSGLMICDVTLSGNYMKGSVLANHYAGENDGGIDFGGVTNYGGSPSVIAGTIETGTGANKDKVYVTMAVTAISNVAKSTRSKTE